MSTPKEVLQMLRLQLSSFWTVDDNISLKDIEEAMCSAMDSYDHSNRMYYLKTGFDVLNTNVYAVFLYYLAHQIGSGGGYTLADKIYYLNKIMNGVEWYWNAELPEHFVVEHPVGSVLGKASYGDYFCIFQGVTVGANFKDDECRWPVLGDYVTMYANSSVIGSCRIGNHVILGANAFVFDDDVPDNSIVFGSSPDLVIRESSEEEIRKRLVRIWNFDRIEK